MIDQFKESLEQSDFDFNSKVLLAVSGGIDSMVLLHLSKRLNLNISVAHLNYQLRGEDSLKDEELVKSITNKHNLPFYSTKVNTQEIVNTSKDSLQVVARELRYDWFQELMHKHNFNYLFTAHHLNDSVETFFINLNRGTGIKGLSGIRDNKNILRPLKRIDRKSIKNYAEQNEIVFREDKSNSDYKYLRNWIRHEIVKPWQAKNPSFLNSVDSSIQYLNESSELINQIVKKDLELLGLELKKKIDRNKLKECLAPKQTLFEITKEFGFSYHQVKNILESIEANKHGQQFFSESHKIIVDRKYIVIEANVEAKEFQPVTLSQNLELSSPIRKISFEILDKTPALRDMDLNCQYIDMEGLKFPLTIRKWKSGDKIIPLGMKGSKKVSDILTDSKTAITEKDKTLVLESGSTIIAILGKLINNNFKIGNNTKQVLKIVCRN